MKIVTTNICPPIPIRSHDWQAVDADTYDGPPCPVGEGATEQEAVEDLCEKLDICPPDCWACKQEAGSR